MTTVAEDAADADAGFTVLAQLRSAAFYEAARLLYRRWQEIEDDSLALHVIAQLQDQAARDSNWARHFHDLLRHERGQL